MTNRPLHALRFSLLALALAATAACTDEGSGTGGAGGSGTASTTTTSTSATTSGEGGGTGGETGSGGSGTGGSGTGGAGTGGSGSGGGSGGAGGEEGVDRLYVVNANSGVTSYDAPAEHEERTESATALAAGADTDIFGPRDVLVNGQGDLMVLGQNDGSVSIFDDAATATGARLPDRKLVGAATLIDTPNAIALDDDVLFVANGTSLTDGTILVWDDASTVDGDVAPSRTFTPTYEDPDSFDPLQMFVQGGTLYVVEQDENTSSVVAFDDAAELDGDVTQDREVRFDGFGSVASAYVDRDDRLYVVTATDEIFIFDGASTLDGDVEPDVTLTVTGAQGLSAVVVDDQQHLIAADGSRAFLYVIDGIDTLASAELAPSREYDALDLSLPRALFLVEN